MQRMTKVASVADLVRVEEGRLILSRQELARLIDKKRDPEAAAKEPQRQVFDV